MTIYVVTSGEYSEYGINRVFLDKEKAEIYCALCNGDASPYKPGFSNAQIETYESSDDDIQGNIDIQYQYMVHEESNEPSKEYYNVFRMHPKNENRIIPSPFGKHLKALVYLTREDPELAFKIGKDMIARYKAEQEGI